MKQIDNLEARIQIVEEQTNKILCFEKKASGNGRVSLLTPIASLADAEPIVIDGQTYYKGRLVLDTNKNTLSIMVS